MNIMSVRGVASGRCSKKEDALIQMINTALKNELKTFVENHKSHADNYYDTMKTSSNMAYDDVLQRMETQQKAVMEKCRMEMNEEANEALATIKS